MAEARGLRRWFGHRVLWTVLFLLCPWLVWGQTRTTLPREYLAMRDPITATTTLCTAATLNAAITAAGSTVQVLWLSPINGAGTACTWQLESDVTLPSTLTLHIPAQVQVCPASGKTLTINGPLEGDLARQLKGTGCAGTLAFGPRTPEVLARWWGEALSATTLTSALTDLGTTAATLVLDGGTWTLASSVTIPSTLTLAVRPGSLLSVASGQTLTVHEVRAAAHQQVFSGVGTVRCGAFCPEAIHPGWFGAVYDATTDDAAAIQAAINMAGSTSGVIGRTLGLVRLGGPAAIATTLVIDRKSVTLDCGGIGDPAGSNPTGAYFTWTGAANGTLLKVTATINSLPVQNCRFIGNTTNVPKAAVSLQETTGVGQFNVVLHNLLIAGPTLNSTTVAWTNGIYIGDPAGAAGDNSQIELNNVRVSAATNCVRLGSTQNVAVTLINNTIDRCGVGLYVSGAAVVIGGAFARNTYDIQVPATDDFSATVEARIDLYSMHSEKAGRLAQLDGTAHLTGTRVYFQLSSSLNADTFLVSGLNAKSHAVILRNMTVGTADSTVNWGIQLKSPAGQNAAKRLFLEDYVRQGNVAQPTIDMPVSAGVNDRRSVCVREWVQSGLASTNAAVPTRNSCNFFSGGSGSYTDGYDGTRYDIATPSLRVGDRTSTANGGAWQVQVDTDVIDVAVATTLTGFVPADALILGVTAKVQAGGITCAGCATWQLGTAASPLKWGSGLNRAASTTVDMSSYQLGSFPGGVASPYYNQTAEDLVVTPNAGTLSTGKIHVSVIYMKLLAPVN